METQGTLSIYYCWGFAVTSHEKSMQLQHQSFHLQSYATPIFVVRQTHHMRTYHSIQQILHSMRTLMVELPMLSAVISITFIDAILHFAILHPEERQCRSSRTPAPVKISCWNFVILGRWVSSQRIPPFSVSESNQSCSRVFFKSPSFT